MKIIRKSSKIMFFDVSKQNKIILHGWIEI